VTTEDTTTQSIETTAGTTQRASTESALVITESSSSKEVSPTTEDMDVSTINALLGGEHTTTIMTPTTSAAGFATDITDVDATNSTPKETEGGTLRNHRVASVHCACGARWIV
jgi:hypothetical protein